ncbi:MAG TPA: hypothetical protein PKW61_03345, partial [Tenuifilaceae bacterium]|nr:hypothetical protein [Tenuifilaceae bacterium]
MKKLLYAFILCFISLVSTSQEKINYVSHYLFPEFGEGIIVMKHGGAYRASLNYNLITNELVFENNKARYAIAKDSLINIDTVIINDKRLVLVKNSFVEILHQSSFELFVEHKCKVSSPGSPAAYGGTSYTSSTSTVTSMNSNGGTYLFELPDEYKIEPYYIYWIRKNGELKRFTNIKQIIKFYDSKKDKIKLFI